MLMKRLHHAPSHLEQRKHLKIALRRTGIKLYLINITLVASSAVPLYFWNKGTWRKKKYGGVPLSELTKPDKMSTVLHFQGTQFKSCAITTKVVLFSRTSGTGSLCCSWRILKSNVTVWWPLLLIKTLPKTALCMVFCSYSRHELICTSYFDHALVKAPNNIFL